MERRGENIKINTWKKARLSLEEQTPSAPVSARVKGLISKWWWWWCETALLCFRLLCLPRRPFLLLLLCLANEISYLFIYSGRDELYEDFNSARNATSKLVGRRVEKKRQVSDLARCVRGVKQIPWKTILDGQRELAREEYRVNSFRKINYSDLEGGAYARDSTTDA